MVEFWLVKDQCQITSASPDPFRLLMGWKKKFRLASLEMVLGAQIYSNQKLNTA